MFSSVRKTLFTHTRTHKHTHTHNHTISHSLTHSLTHLKDIIQAFVFPRFGLRRDEVWRLRCVSSEVD
jgi:hypothetical protein